MRLSDLVAALLLTAAISACGGGGTQAPTTAATTAPVAPATTAPPGSVASASQHPTTGASTTALPTSANATPAASPSQPVPSVDATPGTTASPSPSALIWTQLGVEGGPSARQDHTWTVDGDGRLAYLFGGLSGDGPSDELWAFDLTSDTWAQVVPSNAGPAARFGHTATWVPDVGLVIWSGQGRTGFFADIWRYDAAANAWAELPSQGDVPPARYGSCASLGPDGHLWISHGFTADSGRFADTRSYEFASGMWTDRTPSGDVPVKRCLHDCVWAASGKLILYGGQTTGTAAIGDLWSYDPASSTWTEAAEPEAPPRQLYALAPDTSNSGLSFIVFGGGTVDGGYLDDQWALNAPLPQLYPLETTAGPSARAGATLIADPGGRLLLFGGTNTDGLLGDVWQL